MNGTNMRSQCSSPPRRLAMPVWCVMAGLMLGAARGAGDVRDNGRSDIETSPPPAQPRCPPGMAQVPGRPGKGKTAEVREFCLAITEVTVGEWAKCIADSRCEWPSLQHWEHGTPWDLLGEATWMMGNVQLPMNCIDHPTAAAYCETVGGRLPTAAEWDWANASARENWELPWGRENFTPLEEDVDPAALPPGPVCRGWRHVRLLEHPCAVATSGGDVTAQGVFDMYANLQEWTATLNATGKLYATRGDEFLEATNLYTAGQGGQPPHVRAQGLGVRCAADPI
jgi:formylglycine-generating enzyme required for sulfatase activity